MRVDAVIFDCDGVLVDSEPITMAVLTAMANDAGLSLTEDDAAELFMGKSLREDIRIIESQLGKPLPAGWTDTYLARRDAALSAQVGNNGSPFGVPVSSVRGNVANTTNPSKRAVGYFIAGEYTELERRVP